MIRARICLNWRIWAELGEEEEGSTGMSFQCTRAPSLAGPTVNRRVVNLFVNFQVVVILE